MCDFLYKESNLTFSPALVPNVEVELTPSEISGSAGDVAISFTCTATVEEDIMYAEYKFDWMLNGAPVDQSDDRINVHIYI